MLETITADKIIEAINMENYTVILINLVAYVSGLLLHVLHKMQKDKVTFIQYWQVHRTNSIASIIALTATFIAMVIMSPDAPLYAYFTTAYMGDSFINKASGPSSTDIATSGTRSLIPQTQEEGFATVFGIASIFVIFMLVIHYYI